DKREIEEKLNEFKVYFTKMNQPWYFAKPCWSLHYYMKPRVVVVLPSRMRFVEIIAAMNIAIVGQRTIFNNIVSHVYHSR
ncbi:MAG: hypothetical protein WBE68_26640, partial [Candidatus Nitrosopolaris sp.]